MSKVKATDNTGKRVHIGEVKWSFEGWIPCDTTGQPIGPPRKTERVARRQVLDAAGAKRVQQRKPKPKPPGYTQVRGPIEMFDIHGNVTGRVSVLSELGRLWRTAGNPRRKRRTPRLEVKRVRVAPRFIGRGWCSGTLIRLPIWPGRPDWCVLSTLAHEVVHTMGHRRHDLEFATKFARLCDEAWGIEGVYTELKGRGAWRRVDLVVEAELATREWSLDPKPE